MSLPPVVKSWTFLPNNRIPFVSLIDTSSNILFGLKSFLVATMGYAVKYTCDGTTGPTSSIDHTDRWITLANVQTRASTSTAGAQSFCVLTNANGVDILLVYQGGSDDIFKIAFSPGGLYTPAATANQQPTATDEQICVSGVSIITNAATADRVWHAMATTDKTILRVFIYRADVMTYSFGVEQITPTVAPSVVFTASTVGWSTSNSTMTSVSTGHVLGSGLANNGGVARVNSVNCVLGGCGECFYGAGTNPLACDLSAGAILVAVGYASQTAGAAGKLGNRIDCWYAYNSTTPGQGDTLGDLSHVLFGTAVWPWDGVTYPEIS